MKRTILAIAPAIATLIGLTFAAPALADKIPLNELSRYLNSLKSISADFTQVNNDGTLSTGKVYIQRPGRVRFEYRNDNNLVLASGGNVAVFDGKARAHRSNTPCPRRRCRSFWPITSICRVLIWSPAMANRKTAPW